MTADVGPPGGGAQPTAFAAARVSELARALSECAQGGAIREEAGGPAAEAGEAAA